MDIDIKDKNRTEKDEYKQEEPYEKLGFYAGNSVHLKNFKTDAIFV